MSRRFSTDPPSALGRLEELMRAGDGLRWLLALLPEGVTLADARRLRERVKQQRRRPVRLLDEELGIRR